MQTRILKTTLTLAGLFFLSVGLFLFWAVGKRLPKESSLDIEISNPVILEPKDQITILTYNIGHGQGVKNNPTDWRDDPYTHQKMNEITEAIQNTNADIIALQEVDLDSHRTHHIEQAQWIAQGANYPYVACAVVWDENYVPYPYWPIKHHLGKTKSANCVLSRYPLSNHKRFLFEKPRNNAFWYNWAYLERGAQTVEVLVGEKRFTLINVHLEAFDSESRQQQAYELVNLLKRFHTAIVLGGDFNSIPPEAELKTGFENDQTISIIRSSLSKFTETPKHGHTYPADKPTQRLDAIFAFHGAQISKGRVVNEALQASDHLPVLATLIFQK